MNTRKTSSSTKVKCRRTGTPRILMLPTLPGNGLGFSSAGTYPIMQANEAVMPSGRRIPNQFSVALHVSPCGTHFNGRQIERERLCIVELGVDHHLAAFVNVTPPAADTHRSTAAAKIIGQIELRVH